MFRISLSPQKNCFSVDGCVHKTAKTMKAICVCAFALFTCPLEAQSLECSDSVLESFVGTWSAKGSARVSRDAAREQFRCRFDYQLSGGRLETSGICATVAEKTKVKGWLACESSKFWGPFLLLDSTERTSFVRDESKSGRISLLLRAQNPETLEDARYRIAISPPRNDVSEITITRGAWTAVRLKMRRTK